VVWQRLVEVEEETAKGLETRKVWRTRVFDETHEYVYQDVAEDYGAKAIEGLTRDDGETADTGWIPIAVDDAGMPEVIEHQAGRCPVVWITSTRTTTGPTGEPDCHGTEKLLDKADYTASMATRSANANADPTLKLKDTRQWHMANRTVEKGHGRMIRVSEQGDAELLEASGAAVEMAWKTYEHQRDAVLQTTGAVIIDPKVAGAWAQSGRALSILWRPMEAAAGEKRVPMEGAIEQLADMWRAIGKVLGVCSTEDEEPDGLVLPPVKLDKALAAKQGYEVVEQVVDDDASDVLCVHQVGVGRHVTIVWPPYHEASTEQFAAVAQAATVATGGQAVIAQRSGVRMALRAAGLPDDVEKEIKAIEEEAEGRMERAAAFVDGDEEGSPPPEQDDQDDEPEDDDDDSGDEDEDGDEDA
jgi:hypothetical protein